MIGWLRRWRERRGMKARIAALSPQERRQLLEASPLEAAGFQGEGFHVFRKDVPDMAAAYVTSLGEIDLTMAEDWIIARVLEGGGLNRGGR